MSYLEDHYAVIVACFYFLVTPARRFRICHRPLADIYLHKGAALALRFQLYNGGSPLGVLEDCLHLHFIGFGIF